MNLFPTIRISELQKDLETKERNLTRSKEALIQSVKEEAKPLAVVKNNPKWIFMTLFGALSGWKLLFKFGSGLVFKRKGKIMFKLLKSAWMWKLLKVGAVTLTKKNNKALRGFASDLVKAFIEKKKV